MSATAATVRPFPTIPALVAQGLARNVSGVQAATKRDGQWIATSPDQYMRLVRQVALAFDKNPRVAREMFWMDAEAYAVSLLLTNVTKRVALRSRPYARPCLADSGYDPHCSTAEANLSFYSSHSAMAGTSAGLICFQHQYLQLYGQGGDIASCVGALGLMTATGLFRMASDNHWASDVAVGYALGFASGYGLPLLLHFTPQRTARRDDVSVRVLPYGDGSRVGLWALGAF